MKTIIIEEGKGQNQDTGYHISLDSTETKKGVTTGIFKITHPEKETTIIGFEELITRFTQKDGDLYFVLPTEPGDPPVTLMASLDTRHGVSGWRASRYVKCQWDESYLFFETPQDMIDFALNPTEDALNHATRIF